MDELTGYKHLDSYNKKTKTSQVLYDGGLLSCIDDAECTTLNHVLKKICAILINGGSSGTVDTQMSITQNDDGIKLVNDEDLPGAFQVYGTDESGVKGWQTVITTDELVKVSSNDTTAGYLNGKLVAGTGIALAENNDGANETLSVILNTSYTNGLYWKLLGNTGTTPGTNFLGTTDNKALVFKINNEFAGLINPAPGSLLSGPNGGMIALGHYAGENLIPFVLAGTKVSNNMLVGWGAGRFLGTIYNNPAHATSNENTIIGYWAGQFLQGAASGHGRNALFGQSAGNRMLAGEDNTLVGTFAAEWISTGHGNSAFGRDALRSIIDGDGNVAIGGLSMVYSTGGVDSIAVTNGGSGYTTATVTISAPYGGPGPGTCWAVATGTATINAGVITAVTVTSSGCGYSSRGGTYYTGFSHPIVVVTITGDGSGATATATLRDAAYNAALGGGSGMGNRIGQYNLYLGQLAGDQFRYKDDYMTLVGTSANADSSINPTTKLIYGTAIGAGAKVGQSNSIVLGRVGSDSVGIGTIAPTNTLHLAGSFRYVDGNQAANYVLRSSAIGVATWQELSTIPLNMTLGSVMFIGSDLSLAEDNANFFWDDTNNRLGILTSSPARALDVRGDVDINGHRFGRGNGSILTDLVAGFQAGNALNGSSVANTLIGYQSGLLMTSSTYNTAVGWLSMAAHATVGSLGFGLNVGVGVQTLRNMTTSAGNTAIGANALFAHTTGAAFGLGLNTGIGYASGFNISTGELNVCVGPSSGYKITTGHSNIAIGGSAMGGGEAGTGGVIGSSSIRNLAMGFQTLAQVAVGEGNTALGWRAMYQSAPAIGYNIAIGHSSGSALLTGDYNVILGSNTGAGITGTSNNIIISDGAGTQRLLVNSSGAWSVGGGSGTSGYVLTSNGNAAEPTWQVAAAGYSDSQAQDAIGGILLNTDTIAWTYTGNISIEADVRYQMSITSDASGLLLDGDQLTPGNNYAYATDGTGTKGWYDINTLITCCTLQQVFDIEGQFAEFNAENTIDGDGFPFNLENFDGIIIDSFVEINGMKVFNGSNVNDQNTYMGAFPPSNLRSGNTGIGYNVLTNINNNTASLNTGIGSLVLNQNLTGGNNTAVGYGAMSSGTTPRDSVAIGKSALGITNAQFNVAVGNNALASNVSGNFNTAVGYSVLQLAVGQFNTAYGYRSMQSTDLGEQNTAFGANSLWLNTSGAKNSAFGVGALENNLTGSFNVSVGQDSMLGNTTGNGNIGIGWNGLSSILAGSDFNVGIGYRAAGSVTSSTNGVFIGVDVARHASQKVNPTNQIIIGANAYGTLDNQTVLGNSSTVQTMIFGDLELPSYPNSRNDGGTTSALYVDPSGTVQYGPITFPGGAVTSVSGTANRITSTGGTTPTIDIAATYVGQTSITTLGTIITGTWQSTKIGLLYGGTNADLSTTGGAGQYLKQSSVGATITVGTIPASDIASGAALTKTDDTNVTLSLGGAPTTALLTAASLTLGWTGQLSLARGGTGANLVDPNADRIMFWDDSAGAVTWLTPNTGIAISGTNLNVTPPINTLIAATATNAIDNLAYLQEWDWNSLTTGTAFRLSTNSITTGTLFDIITSGSPASHANQKIVKITNGGTRINAEDSYGLYVVTNKVGGPGVFSGENIAGYFSATPDGVSFGVSDTALFTNQGDVKLVQLTGKVYIGKAGVSSGIIALGESGGGTVQIQPANATGSWTLALPNSGGTNNYVLKTNGSGVSSWVDVNTLVTGSGLTIGTSTITSGTNTRILYNNAGILGEYLVTGTGTTAVLSTSPGFTTAANPVSNDGAALGTTTLQWSDIFLAEGGVINWDNGDATITQSGNTVTLAGADLVVTGNITSNHSGTSIITTQTSGAGEQAQIKFISNAGELDMRLGGSASGFSDHFFMYDTNYAYVPISISSGATGRIIALGSGQAAATSQANSTLNISATEAVFNESGLSTISVRMESDTDSDAFLLNGVDGTITLGTYGAGTITGTPTYNLGITSAGKIIEINNGWDTETSDSDTTTNATIATATTIATTSDTRGTLVVYMDARSSGNGLHGNKQVHWKNVAGTVTILEVLDIAADYLDGLTTATWTVDASTSNLRIRITGEAATTINWKSAYQLKYLT